MAKKPYSKSKASRGRIATSLAKTTPGGKGRIKKRASYKKRV